MSLIHIETTKYGGRGFFANTDIPEHTNILNCPTPLSFTIFRRYKKDVCAYCFSCDFHNSCKVKLNPSHQVNLIKNLNAEIYQDSLEKQKLSIPSSLVSQTQAFGGLFFCSEACREKWIAEEDPTGLVSFILNSIDLAVLASKKSPSPITAPSLEKLEITPEYIQTQWDDAVGTSKNINVLPAAQQLDVSTKLSALSISSSPSSESPSISVPATHPEKSIDLTDTKPEPQKKKKGSKTKKLKIPNISSDVQDMARFMAVLIVKLFLKSFDVESFANKDQTPLMYAFYNQSLDDGFQYFDDLQSNEELYLKTFPDMVQVQILLYKFLSAVLPQQILPNLTPRFLRDTLGRDAANAFGIWQRPITSESELLGSSLYPHASFFNHSCSHNVDKIRNGRSIIFQTNRPIKSDEQLYINYGMYQDMQYAERQEMLKSQWYFDCACDRCLAEKNP